MILMSMFTRLQVPHQSMCSSQGQRKQNDNSHFCSTRVCYCLEMAAKLGNQALVYSADNKNKISAGDDTLAVDRRININRFFPVDDSQAYLDHDFPVPGYMLTPAGYLELCPISTPQLTVDNLGREHFVMPEKGQSTMILCSPHSSNNIASHLSDMTMGGPGFNANHKINEFY